MGTINQIKSKLLELEGGAFQRLCDDWLFKQGYENINSIGMMQTTDRVVKGTPDCLFIQPDGMYVFSEYTVQQTRLASKIEDDINKCFDEKKTGISNDQVREIIVCYLGKLNIHEISHLKEICEPKGIILSLNGLDTISLSIQNRYPVLSEQYLGLFLDTGQLLTVDDFIKRYNQNEFTTTIDNRILFQDDALIQGLKTLEHSNFLLISGPAGLGKTLYSVNLSKLVENKNPNVKVYCVFDKGADLTRDITAHFSEPGEYLIFIDDANRLDSRLEYILHYLNEQDKARTFKIIATVRDYARESVIETASKFTSINEQIISPLTDDQIKELIEKLFNIKNDEYQQRIQEIAGGNARLAIMASKVAVKTQQIQSIQNVASLYDDYFGQSENIKEIIDNKNLIKTVCIISFFRRVDKLNETHMSWVQDIFGIQPEEFWEYVIILHSKEIVDMYEDEVVKVSDQVLSTYLFYLAVFDKKHIAFSLLVSNFYPDLKKTIVDALNPVINAFDHKKIIKVIRNDVLPLFEDICNNKSDTKALEFLNSFWFAMPTESLAFAKKYIDKTPNSLIDWEYADFEESNNDSTESPLIKLLSNFRNYGKGELDISLDMIFLYLEKTKEFLSGIIKSLSDDFCFKPNDWRYGYAIQKNVIKKLITKMEAGNSYLFTRLFILVVKKYLQVEYREHRWTRGDAINIITFRLTPDEHLTPIRKSMFIGLSGLLKINKYKRLVMDLLHDYVSRLRFNGQDMAESDFRFIKEFIVENLDNNDLSDCILVLELCEQLDSLEISYPASWKKMFTNEIIKLSDILLEDRRERRMLEMGYDEYNQYRQQSLTKYFKNFTIIDFKKFMGSCQLLFQSLSGRDRDYLLTNGLNLSLSTLADTNKKNYLEIVSIYIDYDDLFGLNPNQIILNLFDTAEPDNVWMLLNSKEFKWKKSWISSYFSHLPKKYITADIVHLLLDHLDTTPSNELPNWIDFLSSYLPVDKAIFAKVARILVNKSLEDQNYARPLEHLYSTHSEIFDKWFEVFESDESLVFESYAVAYKVSNHFDYSGEALNILTSHDKKLLFRFIDCVYESERWPSSYTNMPNLAFLWDRDSYLEDIEKYALYVHEKEDFSYHSRDSIFKKLFSDDKTGKLEFSTKKSEFIKYTVENNINNENYLCFIFGVANFLGDDFKREILKFFIERNQEFSVFEKIEFEPGSRSWSGSLVPILEKEKDYLLSILPLFNTIDLLEHKAYIEKQIVYKIQHIEHEKKRDFVESRH